MSRLFTKYGIALHVALLIVYASWAKGGSSPYYSWALPWLALGILDIMFLLPPANEFENPAVATKRLLRNIFLDPVTYIGMALVAFLTIQWANGPRIRSIDDDGSLVFSDPPLPSFPSCVEQDLALQVLFWFIAIVVAVIAVRHALKPGARYLLLKLIVANGAVLAVLGFIQNPSFAQSGKILWCIPVDVYFFSTFGYPNHAGAFFELITAINIGLIIRALADKEHSDGLGWMSIALLANIAGALGSLCRASLLLTSCILLFGLIYAMIYLFQRISLGKYLCLIGFSLVILSAGAVFALLPGSPLAKEAATILPKNTAAATSVSHAELDIPSEKQDNTKETAPKAISEDQASDYYVSADDLMDKPSENRQKDVLAIIHKIWESVYVNSDRAILGDAAISIWKKNPWTGVGGWGFRQYVAGEVGEDQWEYLQSAGRANVHNDAYQFLCEHGIIGFGLMSALFIALVVHTFMRFTGLKRAINYSTGDKRCWFRSVSPMIWMTFAGCIVILVHSTLDLPFRSAAVSLVFFVSLACLPAFLPREKK